MKKTKLMLFIVLLLIGIFFVMPAKVFAAEDITAEDWFNHISQYEFGFAKGEISFGGNILIVEEPAHEYEGSWIRYEGNADWFEPELSWIEQYADDNEDIREELEEYYEDYDGYLYWNFEENYWQIAYYDSSDFDNNNNNNKEVNMVTDLLDNLAEIGAGIGDLFGRIVESVGQFFYTPGTGDTPGSFTIIGILTIAAVVVSLSMWVLRLILRLFKLRG